MEATPARAPRRKKRPHDLHLATGPDDLVARLAERGVDLVSLVYEFVRSTAPAGIVIGGSISDRIATPVSDIDVLILLSRARDLKPRLKSEVDGVPVAHLPTRTPGTRAVSLFPAGIEIDLVFRWDGPGEGGDAAPEGVPGPELDEIDPLVRDPFVNRLASGWVIHGEEVVERWRRYFRADTLRVRWMTTDFIAAVKLLEDVEEGIGRAPGHVSALGAHLVPYLLSALLAYHHFYLGSANWMLKIDSLVGEVDPEMRQALEAGARLAFPTLLASPEREREYFERLVRYSREVKRLLSREPHVGEILDASMHQLDVIR
jgi:hypothetical protein